MTSSGHVQDLLDLPVSQMLRRCPRAASLFIRHRLACIGCSFASFHSTHEALRLHAVPATIAESLVQMVAQVCGDPSEQTIEPKGEHDEN